MPDGTYTYEVFISYNRAEEERAEQLAPSARRWLPRLVCSLEPAPQ